MKILKNTIHLKAQNSSRIDLKKYNLNLLKQFSPPYTQTLSITHTYIYGGYTYMYILLLFFFSPPYLHHYIALAFVAYIFLNKYILLNLAKL